MDEKKQIEECYRRMYRGMIEQDEGLLSDVLDDSFVLVHMTGMRQSKAEFIQAIKNGTLQYYAAKHQHINVKMQGEQAELTGQSVVNAAVFGGSRYTWRLQLKLRLVYDRGVWFITEARASTY